MEKTIHRDGGCRNCGHPDDDRRRLRAVGGITGKHFRAASICSAAGGSLQPRVGMCKAFGQGISASGIRLSADSVQNIAAAGVSVIGELVELTRHSDEILFSIPFLLTEVVMGVAALVLLKNVKKYTWKRVRL